MTYGEAMEAVYVTANGGYPNPSSNLHRADIIAILPMYLDTAMQKFALLNRQQRRADGEYGLDLSASYYEYYLPLTQNANTGKYFAKLPRKVLDTAAGPLIGSLYCSDLECEAPVQRSFSSVIGMESLPIVVSWLANGDEVYISKAAECSVVIRAILQSVYEENAEIEFPASVVEDAISECRKFLSKEPADKQNNSIDDNEQ